MRTMRISTPAAVTSCLLVVTAYLGASVSSLSLSCHVRARPGSARSATPYFADEQVNVHTGTSTGKTSDKTVIVAGATGYIGRAVVEESVKRGYNTVALVRSKAKLETKEGIAGYSKAFSGATVVECNVEDPSELKILMDTIDIPVDTVISCLASPIGTKKEAYAIDYQASLNCLEAGQAVNARHFVLLSAFCCRRPLLQLQQAKLKLEAKIQEQSQLTYSIVRPTAFFKSVSGQLEAIQGGNPYVLFGDGAVTRCNPIAECELAEFMLDSLTNQDKQNKILNVGGPDQPLTNKMLGMMMFKAIGNPEPRFVYAPTWIFDYIINALQFLATLTKSQALEDAAETGRIGKYYAVEDMLTTDPAEKYGRITMQEHYNSIAKQGQDPFTPVRATAVIGQALESLPALLLIVPLVWAMMHPKAMEVGLGPAANQFGFSMTMILASLTGHHV